MFHSWVYQLNLHSDGSATQYWTGAARFYDQYWYGGHGRQLAMRDDGRLVVTVITANYAPVPAGSNPNVTVQDVSLFTHIRTTYLFSVDSANTLTRVQVRTRTYGPNDDPTDPGGTLGTLITTPFTYRGSGLGCRSQSAVVKSIDDFR